MRNANLPALAFSALAWLSFAPLQARAEGPHWYRGNTHAHSINSDGDSSPDTVARWYREHGYNFLFITDHDHVTDVAPVNALLGAEERFLLLPGEEITQWGEDPGRSSAHVNALFATALILPMGLSHCPGALTSCGAHAPANMPLAETFQTNIAAIARQHGIAQINHPNYHWSVRPQDLYDIPDGSLLEIWNGQRRINNLGGDAGNGDLRPSAAGYWDILLSRGKIVWGVGSDDSHSFQPPDLYNPDRAPPGQAWIMVRAGRLSPRDIRHAMESGAFYASTGVAYSDIAVSGDAMSLRIQDQSGERFRTSFIGQDGRVLAEMAGTNPSYRFHGDETYVRAATMDSNGLRAWTQPVFRDRRAAIVARWAGARD